MSTAVLERPVEQPRKLDFIALETAPRVREEEFSDPHPLLPVFIAGAISLVLAATLIGCVLMGLALRHSGIMAQ
jgi:hypothetical protein